MNFVSDTFEPNYSTVWTIWPQIEPEVKMSCRGEDVQSCIKIILAEKVKNEDFIFRNLEETTRFAKSIGRWVKRDIARQSKRRREVSLDEAEAKGKLITDNQGIDERLTIIMRNSSRAVKCVIMDVLSGENISTACIKEKISYQNFVRDARQAFYQPSFLREET